MQGSQVFEYAVIRVVPRVEREEFLNVGVVLFVKRTGFLKASLSIDHNRLLSLDPDCDWDEVLRYLNAFTAICHGQKEVSPIASLDVPSRFRWLTAWRSTIVQTSRVHPGLCEDPEKELHRLLTALVS